MPCSLMGPVALWESIGGGRRLYGVLYDKQPPAGWEHIPCPMPPPGTLSWALRSKSYGDTAPQKGLSQTRGLISGTTS